MCVIYIATCPQQICLPPSLLVMCNVWHSYLLTSACLLAWSIGHWPRNVFCPGPSSPSLSPGVNHLLFPFCVSARCFVAYLFASSLGVPFDGLMVFGGFLSVCPIHLHFIFFISFCMGSGLVYFQSVPVVLVTVDDHFRYRILRRNSVFFLVDTHNLSHKCMITINVWSKFEYATKKNTLTQIHMDAMSAAVWWPS